MARRRDLDEQKRRTIEALNELRHEFNQKQNERANIEKRKSGKQKRRERQERRERNEHEA